ncbi:hypothetical protein FA95DRAFT_71356 [Auriscalpium vulgare]|uniref:Uncharacterized protein n=1 Tax=Auriscalpium vulgare TaxID=40419 RepID=A0ACB8S7T4_9AGAM|nr:hypothetical protein FA95DRAFT_71356 [Auriscalpium vulgare]
MALLAVFRINRATSTPSARAPCTLPRQSGRLFRKTQDTASSHRTFAGSPRYMPPPTQLLCAQPMPYPLPKHAGSERQGRSATPWDLLAERLSSGGARGTAAYIQGVYQSRARFAMIYDGLRRRSPVFAFSSPHQSSRHYPWP